MKKVTLKLYPFHELAEDIQQGIINQEVDKRQNEPWPDFLEDDRNQSFEKFLQIFGAKVLRRAEDYTDITPYNDDNVMELEGIRLYKYLVNNFHDCIFYEKKYYSKDRWKDGAKVRRSIIFYKETCCPFTGICYDEDLLDPFRAFLKSPGSYNGNLWGLITDGAAALQRSYESEREYWYSEESVKDDIENGNLLEGDMFTAEGIIVNLPNQIECHV